MLPTRHPWAQVAPVVEACLPELQSVGGELVVVGLAGPAPPTTPAGVRTVPVHDRDLLRLRLRAVREARGDIVAVGEDHSWPEPGWGRAVLRAHAEHPSTPAIVGCLVNGATQSVSGRASFKAFAAPYVPPMPTVPDWRPPPLSTVSLKRSVVEQVDDRPGSLDGLVNRLFADGRMVADDRVVLRHDQDLGIAASIRNGYAVTRSAYGYALDRCEPGRRLEAVRWAVSHLPAMVWRAVRDSQGGPRLGYAERAVVAAIAGANTAGAVLGSLAGSGKAPEHYE